MKNKFERFVTTVKNSAKTVTLATTLTMLAPSVTCGFEQKVVDILNKGDGEKVIKPSDIEKPSIKDIINK